MRRARLACLCVLLLLSPIHAAGKRPQTLLLRHVNLVPMTSARVVEDVSVLVREGAIAAIATGAAGPKAPPGAEVIDGRGGYLVPGLTEMHVHLSNRMSLDLFLGHGVTAVRCMDGTPEVLAWRDEITAGRLRGPTITSGSPFLHRHAKDSPKRYIGSEEDARRLVRQYAAEGYDYIKLAEADDDPFFALLEEARKVGIPVVGHIPNYDLDLRVILESGMASIEHIEELFRVWFDYEPDETRIAGFVEMVRRSGVPISTLIRTEEIKNGLFAEGEAYLTPERLAWIERYSGAKGIERIHGTLDAIRNGDWERTAVDIDFLLRLTRELHDAGVVLLPGTDSGGTFLVAGFGLHEELGLLRRAGLSPYEVLRAATVEAARVLGDGDRRGTIEVGKRADLVLVRSNPLDDLETLRRPVGMVLRGEWIGEQELERLRGVTFATAEVERSSR